MSTNSYASWTQYDYMNFDDRNENGDRQTIFSLHLSENHETWNCAWVLDTQPRGSAVLLHSAAAILITKRVRLTKRRSLKKTYKTETETIRQKRFNGTEHQEDEEKNT